MTLPIQFVSQTPVQAATQLLITVADNWDSIHGQVIVLEKYNQHWRAVRDTIPVTLGKSGLQYAQGLVTWSLSDIKKEGDWKTPVGAFTLSGAYGYATAQDAAFISLPYLSATKSLKAVDDPTSRYYNQIVNEELVVQKDWSSAEDMRRDDHLYKWGIIVDFNRKNVVPGGGSCIFMHLWRDADQYTAGCTAMAEGDMRFLMAWLQPSPLPVLIQGDRPTLQELLPALSLPELVQLLPD